MMAQYRGSIEGARGSATRLGHKTTGLRVVANGWQAGIEVRAYHEEGEDCFDVLLTGGSNGGRTAQIIARVIDGEVVEWS